MSSANEDKCHSNDSLFWELEDGHPLVGGHSAAISTELFNKVSGRTEVYY